MISWNFLKRFFQSELTGKETGNKMFISDFSEFRFSFTANIFGKKATRVKAAARRGINGAGDISF
jgi:hypothetical protein